MTKAIERTAAELDSHRNTAAIHIDTAARLIGDRDWSGARLSLEMAIPHANIIGDKTLKSKIFGYLNTVRSRERKAAKSAAVALPNPFADVPVIVTETPVAVDL